MSEAKRIMIVDDEREDIAMIQASLEGMPYLLETFTVPEKAIASAQEKRYDLVIADFLMPLMDGIELVQAIKKTAPGILSVMLSGFTNLPSVLKAVKAEEISHYMTKPWNSEALKRTIKTLLKDGEPLEKRPETIGNPFLSSPQATAAARAMNEEGDLEKLERRYPGITTGIWKAGQVF